MVGGIDEAIKIGQKNLSYLFVCFQETPFASEIFLCQRAWTLSNPQSPDLFDKAPEICRHIVTFANFLAISP